jgi:hypothetical protein
MQPTSKHHEKSDGSAKSHNSPSGDQSTLAGLEALLGLVDDEDAALATHQLVVTVALHQRFQRVANLHGTVSRTKNAPVERVISKPMVAKSIIPLFGQPLNAECWRAIGGELLI